MCWTDGSHAFRRPRFFCVCSSAQDVQKEDPYVSAVYQASRLIALRSFQPLHAFDAIYFRSDGGKRYAATVATLHGQQRIQVADDTPCPSY